MHSGHNRWTATQWGITEHKYHLTSCLLNRWPLLLTTVHQAPGLGGPVHKSTLLYDSWPLSYLAMHHLGEALSLLTQHQSVNLLCQQHHTVLTVQSISQSINQYLWRLALSGSVSQGGGHDRRISTSPYPCTPFLPNTTHFPSLPSHSHTPAPYLPI